MGDFALVPREAIQGTRISSWWIEGSRRRYGTAYFISEMGTVRDGAIDTSWILFENRRPYGTNREVGVLSRRPSSWDEIDAAVG